MKRSNKFGLPLGVMGAAALAVMGTGVGVSGVASAQPSGTTTYTANLQPIPLNTPTGAASGTLTLVLNGDQAQISETVTGLGATIPTDPATLSSLGIPASFAGKPFPHVQHIHGNAQGTCPTASADANHDGVISTPEAQPDYGPILATLSVAPGGTGDENSPDATNVSIAPGGSSFTYNRTITLDAATVQNIQAGKAVIVVHGLNPANAPKASLTTPNAMGVTLPGASKLVALAATAPALCGPLTASQMSAMPSGAPQTGGGSTAGFQDLGLLAGGGVLLLGAGSLLVARRRLAGDEV